MRDENTLIQTNSTNNNHYYYTLKEPKGKAVYTHLLTSAIEIDISKKGKREENTRFEIER